MRKDIVEVETISLAFRQALDAGKREEIKEISSLL
jgi:hypothetical protein